MVSLIAAPNHFRLPRPSFHPANSPSTRKLPVGTRHNQTALKHSFGVVRRCKTNANEDYSALEQEVLEFMLHSQEPDKFPSRKQLIEAGRRGLADAILRRGGWMARGWDSVSDDELKKPELDGAISKWDSAAAMMGRGKEKCELEINGVERELEGYSTEMRSLDGSCAPCDSSNPTASSSGQSVEIAADGGYGVEGILNGLEKQRNLSLGVQVKRKSNTLSRKQNGLHTDVLDTTDGFYLRKSETMLSLENNTVPIQDNMLINAGRANDKKTMSKLNGVKCCLQPDAWRTWSIQRSGISNGDFEAAEINFQDSGKGREPDSATGKIISVEKGNKEKYPEMIKDEKSGGKNSGDNIRICLQNLELELSSALTLLKSNADSISQEEDRDRLPEDLSNLSDDWEFQENDIMKAQDKLRSLRARFAVLEGKVSLAKIDIQKVMDEKQRKINDSRKALKLLRNTCVIWPNSASEVFLIGSFDGWATRRKMKKLSNGTFCVWLRLYPGRYEIKFVVDGAWKVDPLRPIVNNKGNENNLLMIS